MRINIYKIINFSILAMGFYVIISVIEYNKATNQSLEIFNSVCTQKTKAETIILSAKDVHEIESRILRLQGYHHGSVKIISSFALLAIIYFFFLYLKTNSKKE